MLQCLVFADDAHWHSASHACAGQIQQRVSSTSCPVQERLSFFWYDCGHVHHACLHTLYSSAVLHSMRQRAIRIRCQRKCDSRQVLRLQRYRYRGWRAAVECGIDPAYASTLFNTSKKESGGLYTSAEVLQLKNIGMRS